MYLRGFSPVYLVSFFRGGDNENFFYCLSYGAISRVPGSDNLPIGVAKLPPEGDVVWGVSSVTQSILRVTHLVFLIIWGEMRQRRKK